MDDGGTQEEEKEAEREREAREMKEQSCKKQKTAQTYHWTNKKAQSYFFFFIIWAD